MSRTRLPDCSAAPAALSRRSLVLAPLGLGLLAGMGRSASAATLPAPVSLAAELAAALQARRPLIVMASLHGCPFCKIVRDSHLAPLRLEGQPVVQLDMGSKQPVLGFDGSPATQDRVLRAWGIEVAPTVLFFGRNGREAAERLVGASIPDFYGAYLDERLSQARGSLR